MERIRKRKQKGDINEHKEIDEERRSGYGYRYPDIVYSNGIGSSSGGSRAYFDGWNSADPVEGYWCEDNKAGLNRNKGCSGVWVQIDNN